MGANANGRSWFTGVGTRSVGHPLHRASLEDDLPVSLPGLPVLGPCASENCDLAGGVLGHAQSAFEPPIAEWPPAHRYADIAWVPQWSRVSTAEQLAPALYAFGYLALLDGGERLLDPEGMGGMGGMGAAGSGGDAGSEAP